MLKIHCLNDFEYYTHNVGATIYIELDDLAFPDNEWYDLPLSILDMWCWVIIENTQYLSAEFNLYFMDGPYFVKCHKDKGNVDMIFINNQNDDEKILGEYNMTFLELSSTIYEVAAKVVSVLENKKECTLQKELDIKKNMRKLKLLIKGQ